MGKQIEIAEQIARDASCAQGEFGQRVLSTIPYLTDICDENERLREGLTAAIRAAKLALFVINKQGVMPNSSWESGFKSDLDKATAAISSGERT